MFADKWKTLDGEVISVGMMDINHLRNTLKMIRRNAFQYHARDMTMLERYMDDAPDGAWNALQGEMASFEEMESLWLQGKHGHANRLAWKKVREWELVKNMQARLKDLESQARKFNPVLDLPEPIRSRQPLTDISETYVWVSR